MFLVGVMSSVSILIINLIVFMIGKTATIDSTVVIIIGVVAVAIIAVPLFGFLIFHLYLTITGKTTR